MIPETYIEQWKNYAPWQSLGMIEHDLVISRALIVLFNQPLIRDSLAFRGGTALNKLYIDPPVRYSEDIDLVQIKSGTIGEALNAIRQVLDPWLGEPRRNLTQRSAKLIYRYLNIDGFSARLKIEINTVEHFYVEPLEKVFYTMRSEWFKGDTNILTYSFDELMGTKLRALYQRRKGRDLFDLWYTLKNSMIDIERVIDIFKHYCDKNNDVITRAMFEENLSFKKEHIDFKTDMVNLLSPHLTWNFHEAMDFVQKHCISKISGEPWKGKS